jgi:hypothetical protein
MTKRDEAFEAMTPTIRVAPGDGSSYPLLYPAEGTKPWWTASVICVGTDAENAVAAEIKRRWDSFEAMRKALRACMQDSLFYAEDICEAGSQGRAEGWARIEQANAALRLAEEGDKNG